MDFASTLLLSTGFGLVTQLLSTGFSLLTLLLSGLRVHFNAFHGLRPSNLTAFHRLRPITLLLSGLRVHFIVFHGFRPSNFTTFHGLRPSNFTAFHGFRPSNFTAFHGLRPSNFTAFHGFRPSNFTAFRGLRPSNFTAFRGLRPSNFTAFRGLRPSNFTAFRGFRPSNFTAFHGLRPSNFTAFRGLRPSNFTAFRGFRPSNFTAFHGPWPCTCYRVGLDPSPAFPDVRFFIRWLPYDRAPGARSTDKQTAPQNGPIGTQGPPRSGNKLQMTFRNTTWLPEECFSGHERLPASLRGTFTENRDHNDPQASQDIQGTLGKPRSKVPTSSRSNGLRLGAASQRSSRGQKGRQNAC
ncbi:hypothetical protein CRG98_045398 [Punica granatum]|uniref:Uncharacterized protein n=1 Tax=Punica granatum TaxID=22663 RepID=A0A2I0HR68_PUNGR|nr:hypothetical protein CRG98_045398 [Punica granatum]